MSVSTLNNSIISYCEFFDKLSKHPSNTDIKASLDSVKKYYSNYKKNESLITGIQDYLNKLNTETAYDILLSYDKPEKLWSYVHLMIETIEGKKINLWEQIRSFSDMNAFQNGMGKLWSKGHKTVYTIML